MVSRIQSRNTGYSENLFSHNSRVENNPLNSIDGATALKLDESYQAQEEEKNISVNRAQNNLENEEVTRSAVEIEEVSNNIPSGVSIESASYIENNNFKEDEITSYENENNYEEFNQKLFSEEQYQSEEVDEEINDLSGNNSEKLFDQDMNEEEDFEIPAFLRKQKF